MIDEYARSFCRPPLEAVAAKALSCGISANVVTAIGFIFALFAFAAFAFEAYVFAFLFILFNRFFDGLDGATARLSKSGATDLGGFLDIVSDFIFYAGAIFFFAVGRPEVALPAAFLIFSFMGTSSTFLAYAVVTEKRGIEEKERKGRSFFYLSGLTEGSETIAMLLLICLFPDAFALIAVVFGSLCWVTASCRVWSAVRDFH